MQQGHEFDEDAQAWAQGIADTVVNRARCWAARDVLRNTALVALWRAGGKWDASHSSGASFRTFAFTLIRRACWAAFYKEFYRGRSYESLDVDDAAKVTLEAQVDRDLYGDFAGECERLQAVLNFRERLLINRVYFQGWNLQQFAKASGLTAERIGQMHAEAIEKMRRAAS